MSLTRTFIAVAASDAIRQRSLEAIDRLRTSFEDVRWVEPENMHWTLQFLGDLNDVQVVEVCRRVVASVGSSDAFPLVAHGIGAFPHLQRPRTLWIGAGEGSAQLCYLQSVIESCLADLGFRGEQRKFVPHLTLGRVGRNNRIGQLLAGRLSELTDFEVGTMNVAKVVVMASQLQRGRGPVYHVLARGPLGHT